MTTPEFRTLCAELAHALLCWQTDGAWIDQAEQSRLIARAFAALAQSAPTPEAAPVATDNGLLRCYAEAIEDAVKRGDSHDEAKKAGRRAIFLRALEQFSAPAPAVVPGEVAELVWRLGWIAAQLGDIGWSDDSASVACAATLLQQLSAPAPAVVPRGECPSCGYEGEMAQAPHAGEMSNV
jgi:hypothetical protein